MIWENGIETCILSCKKRIASLCLMQNTGCLGLVHGDDPERYGVGGGRWVHVWELMYTCGWRRQWQPTPVLLPGKSYGQRSLVGFSPWGHEESDTTERIHFYFSLSCIGEGNGSPLQCFCLENPRDREAW